MSKYAFITGGTKGIGKAIAVCLGKAGYNLLLTYVSDSENAASTSKELSLALDVEIRILQADITKSQTIDEIYTYLIENNLRLDAVVFNAGLTCRDSFETLSIEEWERVFYGNIHFPVFLTQRIVGLINKQGSLVFTGSSMGIYPHSVSLAYGVTKSAVHALVKNLVKFLLPYELRVNGVAPGFVDTEWQQAKPVEIRNSIEGKIALGRFCTPQELAGVYAMLIMNDYFNGEVVTVDGGYSYK